MKQTFCLLKGLIPLALILLLGSPLYAQQNLTSPREASRSDYMQAADAVTAVLGAVNLFFVDTVQISELYPDGINYMLSELDPYTVFMSKKEAKEFRESSGGVYGGIGALLRQLPDSVVIIDSPMKGQAADKAGLIAGDAIIAVNGKRFDTATVEAVRNELRGIPGEPLHVTVRRRGTAKPLEFTFAREAISMNPISLSTRLGGDIGYVRLNTFMGDVQTPLLRAINELQDAAPLKGLLLDLRDNGGGLMDQAIKVSGLFLPKGSLIVELKDRKQGQSSRYTTSQDPAFPNLPLVVLINEGSASSSEIVAGALQDYDRAVIVGQKSYGKGLVQSTIPMPDSALLKLTTAYYYIPSGRCIQRINYNHKGGEAETVGADSLGEAFKTQNGRTVYASGGIRPDVSTAPDSIAPILASLLLDTMTYNYVTDYRLQHPQAPAIEGFALSDADYNRYLERVKSNKFAFRSPAKALLENLRRVLTQEKRILDYEAPLAELEQRTEGDTQTVLSRHQEEIRRYLSTLIIQRYYYDEGALLYGLPQDTTVARALHLIQSPARMQQLLSPAQTE